MLKLLASRFRRASGRTRCSICGKTIPRGAHYLHALFVGYGYIYHWRECPICDPVVDAASEGQDPDESFGFDEICAYVAATLAVSPTPPGYLVTWWRHARPGEPLPVEALLATEGVDL